jgi:hypothetical protein
MTRSTIDAAIDRYLAAAARAGADVPDGPATEADLDAVRTALAPLRLADDIIAMWRRVQAPPAMPYPSWISAREALDLWRADSTDTGRGLPIFPIAYESHGFLSAGLVGNDTESTIWSWAYDAEPARLRYLTLAVAFDAAADALDRSVFRWRADHQYLDVVDDDAWDALVHSRNEEAAADGAFDPGVDTIDLQSPLSWPATWQLASGVDVLSAVPRGASTTISDLREASSTSGTVVGTIVGLVGSSDGSRMTLDDGSGRLVVWCPPAADPYFVVRMRNVVEVDVFTLPGNGAGTSGAEVDRLHAAIQDAVVGGDITAAQAAAVSLGEFAAPGFADAFAVAVRPGGSG